MTRGPLYEPEYKPQFSGHETFPLRYGWLKKAFDAVNLAKEESNNKSIFLDDDAIARFGVGKNMVASIRHWATAAGIIAEVKKSSTITTTRLGAAVFDEDGFDPYLENPCTLWLIHWQLCGHPDRTTFFWVFNNFSHEIFDRDHLVKGLEKYVHDKGWNKVAVSTIKRDVDCFILTYVSKTLNNKSIYEDAIESPLSELGLLKPVGRRDGFRLVRGSKPSLGQGVFLFALLEFWDYFSPTGSTLSFESIAHEPGSPGRVFLLTENEIADRLAEIADRTDGALQWSETAGLKQVIRDRERKSPDLFSFLKADYSQGKEAENAFV